MGGLWEGLATPAVLTLLRVSDIEVSHLQTLVSSNLPLWLFLCILDIEVSHLQNSRKLHSSNVQKP